MNILNELAYEIESGKFEDLPTEKQAYVIELLKKEMRTNTYNSNDKVLVISDRRARAIENNSEYYAKLFTNDPSWKKLHEA